MIHRAIRSIHSNVAVITGSTVDNVVCLDKDENIISIDKDAVTTKNTELQAEYDAQAYARNREGEYAALNQFEMQYDDEVNSTTTWKDAIVAIKTKWPKDNSGPV